MDYDRTVVNERMRANERRRKREPVAARDMERKPPQKRVAPKM
jgi:hypothetical protein